MRCLEHCWVLYESNKLNANFITLAWPIHLAESIHSASKKNHQGIMNPWIACVYHSQGHRVKIGQPNGEYPKSHKISQIPAMENLQLREVNRKRIFFVVIQSQLSGPTLFCHRKLRRIWRWRGCPARLELAKAGWMNNTNRKVLKVAMPCKLR